MSLTHYDVVGVGANSVDHVIVLPSTLAGHSKLRIRQRIVSYGGQTATAMAACARLGLATKYVGAVSADDHGRAMCLTLQQAGVDVDDVVVREAPNQSAVILLDEVAGERIVLWEWNDHLRLEQHELPLDAVRSARVVHVDDVDEEAALGVAAAARAAGAIVTSDLERVTERTPALIDAARTRFSTNGHLSH